MVGGLGLVFCFLLNIGRPRTNLNESHEAIERPENYKTIICTV